MNACKGKQVSVARDAVKLSWLVCGSVEPTIPYQDRTNKISTTPWGNFIWTFFFISTVLKWRVQLEESANIQWAIKMFFYLKWRRNGTMLQKDLENKIDKKVGRSILMLQFYEFPCSTKCSRRIKNLPYRLYNIFYLGGIMFNASGNLACLGRYLLCRTNLGHWRKQVESNAFPSIESLDTDLLLSWFFYSCNLFHVKDSTKKVKKQSRFLCFVYKIKLFN